MSFALLKHLHMLLAGLTGVWFAARGFWRLGLGRAIASPLWRIAPHVIDTLLLATGVALAVRLGLSPVEVHWFGVKLLLVVVYILLGIGAFRARRAALTWPLFAAALATWLWIISIAMSKQVLPWA